MKNKRMLSLICVLALVMTLTSSFTYAAMPEPEDSANAAPRCYTLRATLLYRYITGDSALRIIAAGEELIMLTTIGQNNRLHVRTTDGMYTGYVSCDDIVRPN